MWPTFKGEEWDKGMDQFAEKHFLVLDQFLPPPVLETVCKYFNSVEAEDRLKAAAIGPGKERTRISEIRSDFVHWLDRPLMPELETFFEGMDAIRASIAESLFLSLRGYEFHLAKYPKGAFYKPHFDQFNTRENRMISVVIYLNENWKPEHGGALKLHKPQERLIEPVMNRMVMFRSDTVLHEVLPAHETRRSLTGWLLKHPATVGVLGI
ncbi:2OG-Fe(II) oxygenase [Schleiferiaceae bacterium]|nr:2OG-Fe(II) oxygenase [Schleiferiaceae bacterium]MDB4177239.1 2OG-Fe(II) oxygenase [Schleiferiaceae bacterium]MDC1224801.1 2OG-Fe(II) oxygenase [Schleiferiaceae bacterium]MDC1493560.1 2OG-Fe(II) oxygenase [Schleiferiaceae bacterium]